MMRKNIIGFGAGVLSFVALSGNANVEGLKLNSYSLHLGRSRSARNLHTDAIGAFGYGRLHDDVNARRQQLSRSYSMGHLPPRRAPRVARTRSRARRAARPSFNSRSTRYTPVLDEAVAGVQPTHASVYDTKEAWVKRINKGYDIKDFEGMVQQMLDLGVTDNESLVKEALVRAGGNMNRAMNYIMADDNDTMLTPLEKIMADEQKPKWGDRNANEYDRREGANGEEGLIV